MRLDDLQDGQRVQARRCRAGEAWGPWMEVVLHIERAPNTPANRKKKRVGELAVLALKGVDWAEYAQRDFHPDARVFVAEDYYLEIEGL